MDALRAALRGEERLWKVFWIYGFAFNLVMFLLAHEADMHLPAFFGKLFYVIACLYFIFSAILQWRCAFNAERRIWGLAVRLLIIGGVLVQAFFLDYILFIKLPAKPTIKTYHTESVAPADEAAPPTMANPSEAKPARETDPVSNILPTNTLPQTSQDKYRTSCEQNLADYATKNGADPKAYIAQNQAYIDKCVQYYMNKDKTVR